MENQLEKKFFYSNSSKVMASPYDVTIQFERVTAPQLSVNIVESNIQPEMAEILELSMSPSHAKAVLIGLCSTIASYENTIGKIAMPEDKEAELAQLLSVIK